MVCTKGAIGQTVFSPSPFLFFFFICTHSYFSQICRKEQHAVCLSGWTRLSWLVGIVMNAWSWLASPSCHNSEKSLQTFLCFWRELFEESELLKLFEKSFHQFFSASEAESGTPVDWFFKCKGLSETVLVRNPLHWRKPLVEGIAGKAGPHFSPRDSDEGGILGDLGLPTDCESRQHYEGRFFVVTLWKKLQHILL